MSEDIIEDPPTNWAVLNTVQIIKTVMSSVAEAELGVIYINAQESFPIRVTLEELGHKQPNKSMHIDYSIVVRVVNSNIQPRRNKAIDMSFH